MNFTLKPSHFVVVGGIFVVLYLMTFVQTPIMSYTNKLYSINDKNSDIGTVGTNQDVEKQKKQDEEILTNSDASLMSLLFPSTSGTKRINDEYDISDPFVDSKDPKTSLSLFSQIIGKFDWDGYSQSVRKKPMNITEIERRMITLINLLNYFLIMEPKVPVNQTCEPPVLTEPENIECANPEIGSAFTGNRLNGARKVGILVQFGFGVDVLEIYLNEMYDVVDQFFITESTKAHFRTLNKPLMWEEVKNQPRFLKFSDKVTHFIIDDAQNAAVSSKYRNSTKLIEDDKMWSMEQMQEASRWNKFLEWNKHYKMFGRDDLIGFGDADEIPARKMVHMMKYCEWKKGVLDFGIWFPFGNIKRAFATDFPIPGHKYTLGDPSFWTLDAAMSLPNNKVPGRQRGSSGSYLLGGIHMTHYGYLPYQFIRDLSCTECGPWGHMKIEQIGKKIHNNEIRDLEIEHGSISKSNLARSVNLTQIAKEMENIAILPWFYDCNRNRYPVWEGNHDTRLD